ncbi:NAD(P)H-hydrate epimerase [Candidatus Berkelbacteria bacterium]|nr:NAD(P)H-hydrate epimerase [Candidatus Berkelbacteria bacterium]
MPLGVITAEEMRDILRHLTEADGFPVPALIENAANALVTQVRLMLERLPGSQIIGLAGPGQTGAVTIATARRLAGAGAQLTILLATERSELSELAAAQLRLAEPFGIRIFDPGALIPPGQLVIDGLVGSTEPPALSPSAASLVDAALRLKLPILAIDVPSGLNATTGKADLPTIRADVTVTLGYPKAGLRKPFAKNLVGRLVVADIGIPPTTWKRRGLLPPDFTAGPLVEVLAE